jgi:hypothetical protein
MEILKSSLKQVPEADRVKGRVYGVSDECRNEINFFAVYNDGDSDVHGREWVFWFELPESMLPVRELPDEFELKELEWEKLYEGDWCKLLTTQTYRRIKPALPALSIPAGTKAEQLEFLRGVIATMEGGGV